MFFSFNVIFFICTLFHGKSVVISSADLATLSNILICNAIKGSYLYSIDSYLALKYLALVCNETIQHYFQMFKQTQPEDALI